MSHVNGPGVVLLPEKPAMSAEQQACIDLLADALEEATKGRISSCAIVVCMDDGIATVMAGKQGAALNIGCDDIKHKIHAAMFLDGNVARKKSSIINQRGR
jgi:hypothetical protein